MRVLVCGSRDIVATQHVGFIKQTLAKGLGTVETLIHGAAPGADSIGGKWAFDNGITIESYPAEWSASCYWSNNDRNTKPTPCSFPSELKRYANPTRSNLNRHTWICASTLLTAKPNSH